MIAYLTDHYTDGDADLFRCSRTCWATSPPSLLPPHLPPLSAAACPSSPVQLELKFSLWNPDDLITRFHESWMWKGYASGVQLGSQYFVGHWTPSVQLINQIQFYDDFSELILISSTTFANGLISLRLALDVWIINHEMSSSLVLEKRLCLENVEQRAKDYIRQSSTILWIHFCLLLKAMSTQCQRSHHNWLYNITGWIIIQIMYHLIKF